MKTSKMQKIIIAVGLALGLAQCVQANLIVNGDFETGDTTGWTLDSGLGTVSTPAAHTGSYGYFYNCEINHTQISQEFADTPGTTYQLSCWLHFQVSDAEIVIFWDSNNGNNGNNIVNWIPANTAGEWQEFSCQVIGDGDDTLGIYFVNGTIAESWGNTYLDDVSVTAVQNTPDVPSTFALLMLSWFGIIAARRKLGGKRLSVH